VPGAFACGAPYGRGTAGDTNVEGCGGADIEELTYVETAEISASHPALAGHFPDHPVVPGAVVLTFVEDALGRAFAQAVSAVVLARFHAALTPARPFTIELTRRTADAIDFRVSAEGALMASGKLRVRAIGEAPQARDSSE
jgi:3-hydroxymyristoyl/3-hydroxydecanoyl-(acyl carrier protein) dehydratase